MKNLRFIETGEPSEKEMAVITKGMLDHHESMGYPRIVKPYSILLKDKEDVLFGCVIVSFRWNGMQIKTLWIEQSIRNQGWGKKLMEAAEKEAIRRGCTFAYTDTFSWQAPKFYEKLGYSLYGKLDNYPPDNSLSYYKKTF